MRNNRDEYRLLCSEHHEIPLFLQSWWLDASCGDAWNAIFSYNSDGSVRGVLSYLLRKKLWLTAIMPPLLTPYQGLWLFYPDGIDNNLRSAFEAEVCTDLISQLDLLRVGFYEQAVIYKLNGISKVIECNYKKTERRTYRLYPIPSVESIIDGLPDRKRRLLKSKVYSTLKPKIGLDAETFYNAYRQELKEKGSNIFYSLEYFKGLYNAARLHNSGEIISLIDPDGNIHSALWIVWDSDSAYTEVLYINNRFRNSGASIGVIIEAIKFLEGKCKAIDFAGSMIPAVAERNKMLGGTPYPCFMLSKASNPLLKLWYWAKH